MKSKTVKVVLALLLCPLLMFALSLMLPKRYTATVALLLDQNLRVARPDSPVGGIVDKINFGRGRTIATQLDEILGNEVLLNAISKTAEQHPDAFKNEETNGTRYASLLNRLRVDNNKDSDIVELRVTMDDPTIAADTANNIGDAYMDFSRKMSMANGQSALADLDEALNSTKAKLAKVDAEIHRVKTQYNISDAVAAGAMQDKQQKDLEFQIAQTEAQYTGALGELDAARRALSGQEKYIRSNSQRSLNPQAQNLDDQISRVSSDLQALRAKFTDDYPQVRQLSDKLNDLKSLRARTPDSIESGTQQSLNPNYMQFQSALAAAQAKVSNLQNSLGTLRSSSERIRELSRRYPEAEQKLAQLNRERSSLEMAYNQTMQMRSGLEATNSSGREAQAQIVSVALAPGTPSFPNPRVFVLMGLAIGIIISALIVMPKAPDILYTPSASETLALDPSMRPAVGALPEHQEPAARPAIESGRTE